MATSKTKLELVKEAQVEQQDVITSKRQELLQALLEQDSIGGKDDLEASLLEIIQKTPTGIKYPFLQTLFPDALLTKARDALKKAGKIEQVGKKGNVVLKLAATK